MLPATERLTQRTCDGISGWLIGSVMPKRTPRGSITVNLSLDPEASNESLADAYSFEESITSCDAPVFWHHGHSTPPAAQQTTPKMGGRIELVPCSVGLVQWVLR